MEEQKKQEIFEALQGITYLEWRKISHTVERAFQSEATTQTNKIVIATPEKLHEYSKLSL